MTTKEQYPAEEPDMLVNKPMRLMCPPKFHPDAPMKAYLVTLGCLDGTYRALIELPDALASMLTEGDVVLINGWHLDDEVADAEIFGEVRAHVPATAAPIESVPLTSCGEVGASIARRIAELIDHEIANPVIAQASHSQLARHGFHERYFSAPASANAHHDRPGGLALHSYECAVLVAAIPRRFFHNSAGRDLAITAALLHDAGKTEFDSGRYCCHGTGHETRTIALLGPMITWLREHEDPSVAEHLLYLLSADARRPHASCPESIAVAMADRLSATADAANQAFANAPRGYKFARRKLGGPYGDKVYYRALETYIPLPE